MLESWLVGLSSTVCHWQNQVTVEKQHCISLRVLPFTPRSHHIDQQIQQDTMVVATGTTRRKAPSNSLLNQTTLISTLEDAGLYGTIVKPVHIEGFYQALHRQHYPEPEEFVANYYRQDNVRTKSLAVERKPLKNSITRLKNANKLQLPRAFLEFLRTRCPLRTVTSRVADMKQSADKSTTKLVIELYDGHRVESVLMRYDKNHRTSLCVSSQV